MDESELSEEQEIQEAQYEFPYHYLPRIEDGHYSQLAYWSWGFQYLGGIELILDLLDQQSFDSVLDVGCGDGRFLSEVASRYSEKTLRGIDYSNRSVRLANAMNETVPFECRDILSDPPSRTYDVVTSIEVLEHIKPEQCEQFVAALAEAVAADGALVLTVPHVNKDVSDKHYQHFDSDHLDRLLRPHFSDISYVPFDEQSSLMVAIQFLLGWRGKHVVVNSPFVLDRVYEFYRRRYLYADDEEDCQRIAVVATDA
jgi:SAM-dependent methyltransferase